MQHRTNRGAAPETAGSHSLDAFCTTGDSPGSRVHVHLVGLGPVGRALARRLPTDRARIVGFSDRSGSLFPSAPEDAERVLGAKSGGGCIADLPGAVREPLDGVLERSTARVVVDATHTDLDREEWPELLERAVLSAGRTLVSASKDAVCRRGARWVDTYGSERVRFNAVLGGAGAALAEALPELRDHCDALAVAGNASTTAIIGTVEEGGTIGDGIAEADRLGLLEADPELDLTGVDAAVKLAIAVGLVTGSSVSPSEVPRPDVRALEPRVLQERRESGFTTRLVGRYGEGVGLGLGFERVRTDDALAVPGDRVIYGCVLRSGERRHFEGAGLGPDATADAAIQDILSAACHHIPTGGDR